MLAQLYTAVASQVCKCKAVQFSVLLQAWLQGMNPQTVQFLMVRIRRGNVLEDALNQIATRADELKKPLRIIFSSGTGLQLRCGCLKCTHTTAGPHMMRIYWPHHARMHALVTHEAVAQGV